MNAISLYEFGAPDAEYDHMIQSFHRLLLDQLCSEGNTFPDNPSLLPRPERRADLQYMEAAPITQLLGIDTINIITCGTCKAVREKENMTNIVDMVNPKSVSRSQPL